MTRYRNLHLDHQLCFALCSATRAITRAYRVRLERIGLTYTQYLAFLALWENDGQTVRGLADRLDLDSATMTPLLKRLERAGLVTRDRSPRDERVVEVHLTDGGRELQHKAAIIQREVAALTGMEPDEFTALRNRLHKLADTVSAAEQSQAVPG